MSVTKNILPADIVPGTRFQSPREDEGVVTAVCSFGDCRHGHDRPDSVHVRGSYSWGVSDFFIALISYEELEVLA